MINRIIPITELRRNFGAITDRLAETGSLILTKGGKPFAILKPATEEKKKMLKKTAGVWRDTEADDDNFWNNVLKRKSRRKAIRL